MFQTKVVQKTKTHILCSIAFFENHAIYEIMWKNFEEPGRPQRTKRRMRTACWTPKDTDTHSPNVILTAFTLQQCLHVGTSMLRHTYTACLVQITLCWEDRGILSTATAKKLSFLLLHDLLQS